MKRALDKWEDIDFLEDQEGNLFTAMVHRKLADLLMISPRPINQLENKGVVVKHSHGKYHLIASVQGYLDYLRYEVKGEFPESFDISGI